MKTKFKKAGILLSAMVMVIILCANNTNSSTAANVSTMIDTIEAGKGTWVSLFDGKSLDGWHGFNNKNGKISNWIVEEGVLVCLGVAIGDTGGDIVSDKEYQNFELSWEWKISKAGNSGVMYQVIEDPKYRAPWETGPEYQLIDDIGFSDKLEESHKTGANYGMHIPNDKKKLNPAGEWNTSKIIFNNGHVEHWLNGEKIVEFEAWTDEWDKKKAEGKWKDFPDYGSAKKGRIALQDHGSKAYFKNILIRKL